MHPRSRPTAAALDEHAIDRLQSLLEALPAPLEPLDVTMLDGFLCGVLVQPVPVPADRWLPYVTDVDGRAPDATLALEPLHALVLARHAELADAIQRRRWFDPWVFELEGDGPSATDAVYPWVAGFAAAMALLPALLRQDARALLAPLALLYRHLDAGDLEDADELLAEIETLEPPADLSEAVQDLVRATLRLADVSRPIAAAAAPSRRGPPRRPKSGRR